MHGLYCSISGLPPGLCIGAPSAVSGTVRTGPPGSCGFRTVHPRPLLTPERTEDTVIDRPTVAVTLLDEGIEPPSYALAGDAGADLRTTQDVVLAPGERALVPTGVAIALPEGYVGLVHPRSGLAVRHGLTLVNSPGTIDAGYRGEIKVPLLNTDRTEPIRLQRGDRIAQLVIQQVAHARFDLVQELPDSARGAQGFGSTGGFGTATAADSESPAH